MIFTLPSGRVLSITRAGFNANLPLIRKDSETHPITGNLWGIYTPSSGQGAALLMGSKEDCQEAIKEFGGSQS